jgi:hypothetical protein
MSRPFWAVAAMMAVGVVACSGTPPSVASFAEAATDSSQAYVRESQQISSSYQRTVEIKVLDIVATGPDTSIDEATNLVRTETVAYLALLTDALGRYVDDFSAIEVPDAIRSERDTYLNILSRSRDAIPTMRDAVSGAGTIPDIQRVLVSSALADAQIALENSCLALEQAVRDQGQGIDLKCARSDLPIGGSGP